MFRKLSVALLIAASPVMAEEAEPSAEGATAQAPQPVAYKTKKICRTEVVGSAVPKTTCRTKKIPIKPVESEATAEADTPSPADSED
jgi:hypothetical protein